MRVLRGPSIAMQCTLVALLPACADRVRIDVPPEIAFLAMFATDTTQGEIMPASIEATTPLFPAHGEAPLIADHAGRTIVVGFTQAQIDNARSSPTPRMFDEPLAVAPSCGPRLPDPSWSTVLDSHRKSEVASGELPSLTATWIEPKCPRWAVDQQRIVSYCGDTACAPVRFTQRGCDLEVDTALCGHNFASLFALPDGRFCSRTTSTAICNVDTSEQIAGQASLTCGGGIMCALALQPGTEFGCANGVCSVGCTESFSDCNGVADDGCEANVKTSTTNCGECNHVCAPFEVCQDGVCRGILEVAIGGAHACARFTSGRVACWGDNTFGQLGNGTAGTPTIAARPVFVRGLETATKLVSGFAHSCAILSDSTVVCWGWNDYGQLGDGTMQSSARPHPVLNLENVMDLASGWTHACAIASGGAVFCWGDNSAGELGISGIEKALQPVRASVDPALQLALANGRSCAQLAGGTVPCWGNTTEHEHALDLGAQQIAAGESFVCARYLGGEVECSVDRFHVQALKNVSDLKASGDLVCAARSQGPIACWGVAFGQIFGTATGSSAPYAIPGSAGATSVAVGGGAALIGVDTACFVGSDGRTRCWGSDAYGLHGAGVGVRPGDVLPASRFAGAIAWCAGDGVCVLSASGSVQCFGTASSSAELLDDGVTVQGLGDVVQLACGGPTQCARTRSGAIECWGSNASGQLGDGTFTSRDAPKPVSLSGPAVDIAVGQQAACAVLMSGDVECWGDLHLMPMPQPNPYAVDWLHGAVQVSVGIIHACAVLAGGRVACWGASGLQELIGTTSATVTHAFVTGIDSATQVSAGYDASCARLVDGSLRCWGADGQGQLGDGMVRPSGAGRVAQVDDALSVHVGFENACAVRGNGGVVCWGGNAYGLLAEPLSLATHGLEATPIPVEGPSSVIDLVVGTEVACARSSDRAWCWGENNYCEQGGCAPWMSATPEPIEMPRTP
jgi:alpha-tubulin suppressor-like RCC1 family protein